MKALRTLFGLFRDACQTKGIPKGDKARETAYRRQLTQEALGKPYSWSSLTEEQIDTLKPFLAALAAPENIQAQMDVEENPRIQPRKRHLFVIDRFAREIACIKGMQDGGERYVAKIATDQYGPHHHKELPGDILVNWRDVLTENQLRNLKLTLSNRLGGMYSLIKRSHRANNLSAHHKQQPTRALIQAVIEGNPPAQKTLESICDKG